MERLTIPDVRLDGNTIKRSIIDAQKVKECAMELYWRLKDIEDAIADEESEEYNLSRLRELVQADKEGKAHIGRCVECSHYEGLAVCEFLGDCGGTDWICGWFEPNKAAESALKEREKYERKEM